MSKTVIHCQREIFTDSITVHLGERDGNRLYVANKPELKEIPDGSFFTEPFLRLKNTDAQLLMDELWNCGLRPSEGSGSAGSLAATERHLRDLQRIVFKEKA